MLQGGVCRGDVGGEQVGLRAACHRADAHPQLLCIRELLLERRHLGLQTRSVLLVLLGICSMNWHVLLQLKSAPLQMHPHLVSVAPTPTQPRLLPLTSPPPPPRPPPVYAVQLSSMGATIMSNIQLQLLPSICSRPEPNTPVFCTKSLHST